MRERNRAVKKSITPPVATDVDDVGDVPGVAPISDDGSVDSSLFSHASESEGDIWGNNNYDDASIAHEGSNLDCFNPHVSSFWVMYFQKARGLCRSP